jgi:uncharacterized protein (TIGR02996 family)
LSDDYSFLQAVLADPRDDALRQVYADWLEEHGDPRADYLRLELALAGQPDGPEAATLRRQIQELRPRLDPLWLAHLDQPAVVRANPTVFPTAWFSDSLGGVRASRGPFGSLCYEELPPLPVAELRGDFAWLLACDSLDSPTDNDRSRWQGNAQTAKQRLAETAASLGLTPPPEFLRYVGDIDLQMRPRNGSDYVIHFDGRIEPSPAGDGGYLLPFDSLGDCHVMWELYLTTSGYSCVVATSWLFNKGPATAFPISSYGSEKRVVFCAPSFEAFLFRYWLENEISHALDAQTPLTALQQAYLDHYRGTR